MFVLKLKLSHNLQCKSNEGIVLIKSLTTPKFELGLVHVIVLSFEQQDLALSAVRMRKTKMQYQVYRVTFRKQEMEKVSCS